MWAWAIWPAIGLFGVIAVKYYTAVGSKNLEQRLNRVKAALVNARQKLKSAREEQSNVAEDVEEMEERIRRMKEIIDDLGMRMKGREEEEEPVEKIERPNVLMRF